MKIDRNIHLSPAPSSLHCTNCVQKIAPVIFCNTVFRLSTVFYQITVTVTTTLPWVSCGPVIKTTASPAQGCSNCTATTKPPAPSSDYQVEAEAELQGWHGLRGWTRIRSHAETTDHSRKLACARVPVKKIGSRDLIFGLVNFTQFFKITNHNQHASNITYLANLIKKYWTCFSNQKPADFLVCFPPSVRVQVRWPPSFKICLRIQLSFGFWGRAVKAFDNFSRKLAWLLKIIF